jgi:transmembrane sensor
VKPHLKSPAKDPAVLHALAEASAWIVTLHGPERTEAVDRGFKRWLEENPVHRYAFEHATDTWANTKASVRRAARFDVSAPHETRAGLRSPRWSAVFALAASLIVATVGAVLYLQRSGISTAVGERRQVVLEDGTQISINTATRLLVRYSQNERRLQLESGEALFDVARDPARPFVVTVGDREVRALGTSFLVRRDDERVAVTLVDGKVEVSAAGILAPGERVTFTQHNRPQLDRPQLEKLTAWQQGLVNIDDMTLSQAVAEMNRYTTARLVVEGPAADIHVSGVFRITDAENMAKAVAMTHGLELREEGRRIVLSGIPQPPSEARFDSP